ncbi:MAG: serine protease [Chitinophagaceae bacterium]
MEDLQLLETIEKYLDGKMTESEAAWFEELRNTTPEIDQMVVEHKLFTQQINDYSKHVSFKQKLHSIHNRLSEKGDIDDVNLSTRKAKVIFLWNKYKRVTAIAASIASITALVIYSLVSFFAPVAKMNDLQQLSKKIDQVQRNQQMQGARILEFDSKIPNGYTVTSGGTAFLIDGKGYLITNAHVIKGSGAVVVNNKGNEFKAKIITVDIEKDLALLKISDDDYKKFNSLPYSISKSNIDLGTEIFTLGYPKDEIVYNMGYLSARNGFNGDTTNFQISLNANPGNSGGPVFNNKGEIVGIISTRQAQAEGVVFAVKAKNIFDMLKELKESDTSFLGIKMPVNTTLKNENRVNQIRKVEDYVFLVKSYNSN